MKHCCAALLCLALVVPSARAEVPIACDVSPTPLSWRPSIDFTRELPLPDYLSTVTRCFTPMLQEPINLRQNAPSQWLDAERERYLHTLASSKASVLVVPLQIQGYGLDRAERALMSADLAYAIGGGGPLAVADPFLVSRALGEGSRRIDPRAIESLATELGVRHVVTGYVGHDKHHHFTLTLQVSERGAATPPPGPAAPKPWQKSWILVGFTDDAMPSQILHTMLPALVADLPLGAKRPPGRLRIAPAPKSLPALGALASATKPGTSAPDLLNLLGALTASTDERSRERAFVRAVFASRWSTGDTARLRFHEAYGLMNLERRPASLALLTGLDGANAATLRALLQGDYPTAQQAIGRVADPLDKLLLAMSLRDLQLRYLREPRVEVKAAATLTIKNGQAWDALIQLRSNDADVWAAGGALDIKLALDAAFPLAGVDAESIIRGGEVVSDASPGEVDVDIATLRHVRKSAESVPVAAGWPGSALRPTPWDVLWLFEGLAESDVEKQVNVALDQRAQASEALELIAAAEPFFSGNPVLVAARAHASAKRSGASPRDVTKTLTHDAEEAALVAEFWSQGESRFAARAFLAGGPASNGAYLLEDAYAYDYPRRAYWMDRFLSDLTHPEQRAAFAKEALAFSRDDLTPLAQLKPGQGPGEYEDVTGDLGTRFAGNANRPHPSRAVAEQQAAETDPIPRLERELAANRDLWPYYERLGGAIMSYRHDLAGAVKVYASYPGFTAESPPNSVQVSVEADLCGWALHKAGHSDLARQFFAVAARLGTGSAASDQSIETLATLDGDFMKAAQAARARATSYNDRSAYRSYLEYLHVLGRGSDAWKGFSQLNATYDTPEIWMSALVGHGREGADERAVRQWLTRPEIRTATFHHVQFAPFYAVLWSATDHLPGADLGRFVEQLEGPPVGRIDADGVSVLLPQTTENGVMYRVTPDGFRFGKGPHLPPGTPVRSKVAMFADAYGPLRRGDFSEAHARFTALADRYAIEDVPGYGGRRAFPLAYFAYAAAKTGDKLGLEAYIKNLKLQPNPNFDVSLADALFAAARKDSIAAAQGLAAALSDFPELPDRPILPEYQYAEVCEWVFRETGDEQFRKTLLEWAKRYQNIRPASAWSYAMEYAYAKGAEERRRALAIADYLDPTGAHIHAAPKGELAEARAWFQQHNPFVADEHAATVARR